MSQRPTSARLHESGTSLVEGCLLMSFLFLIVVSSVKTLEAGIKAPLYKVALVMTGGGTDEAGDSDEKPVSE